MKKLVKSLAAVALASTILAAGCSNGEEKKDDAKQEQNTETSTNSQDNKEVK